MMKKHLAYWFRWLAVLPGALVTGMIVGFPLHWVLYSTLTSIVKPYPELPERILFPFVVAAVFVWVGSCIAPAHKFKTAIALFGVWLFVLGGFVFLTLTGSNWMGSQLYFQGGGIAPIMAAAGAATGLLIVRKRGSSRIRVGSLMGCS
jgi:hypothetical protein